MYENRSECKSIVRRLQIGGSLLVREKLSRKQRENEAMRNNGNSVIGLVPREINVPTLNEEKCKNFPFILTNVIPRITTASGGGRERKKKKEGKKRENERVARKVFYRCST